MLKVLYWDPSKQWEMGLRWKALKIDIDQEISPSSYVTQLLQYVVRRWKSYTCNQEWIIVL